MTPDWETSFSSGSKRPRNTDLADLDGENGARHMDWCSSKRCRVVGVDYAVTSNALRANLSIYQQLVPAADKPESKPPKPIVARRRAPRELSLKGFSEIPLDILEAICQHLSPRDLLHLAQTSRALRHLLLHKSYSTVIWKRAREAMHFYSCPPNIAEPQLASLLFDNACHACGYHGPRKLKVCYTFRLRLCCPCLAENFVQGLRFASLVFGPNIAKDTTIYHLLPYYGSHREPDSWEVQYRPTRWASKQLFLRHDFAETVSAYTRLPHGSEQLQKFVDERKQETKERITTGIALVKQVRQMETAQRREKEELAKMRRQRRIQELETIRANRHEQIIGNLRGLGYTDYDLETYSEGYERRWKMIVEMPRKLTNKEWTQIRPQLVTMITSRRERWREHMHALMTYKRRWDLQREFFTARMDWKVRYPSSLMQLSFRDICKAPMVKAYLDRKSGGEIALTAEWWDGLITDMSQHHSEQVSILAACCRFLGTPVAEAASSYGAIQYKAGIFNHAIAFCWDCSSPGTDVRTYFDEHLLDTEGCRFHGFTGKWGLQLQTDPPKDPDDLVPSIFIQDNLREVARSTSNPAFIACCLFYALEQPLDLSSNTTMHDMDAYGNRFVCIRCSPSKRVTKSWRELVQHMVAENQKFVYARQAFVRIAEELDAHDITRIGALVKPVPGLPHRQSDQQDPFGLDIWETEFREDMSEWALMTNTVYNSTPYGALQEWLDEWPVGGNEMEDIWDLLGTPPPPEP